MRALCAEIAGDASRRLHPRIPLLSPRHGARRQVQGNPFVPSEYVRANGQGYPMKVEGPVQWLGQVGHSGPFNGLVSSLPLYVPFRALRFNYIHLYVQRSRLTAPVVIKRVSTARTTGRASGKLRGLPPFARTSVLLSVRLPCYSMFCSQKARMRASGWRGGGRVGRDLRAASSSSSKEPFFRGVD